MRIIGGNFKGKKLELPDSKYTRPLKDLVKESIFNLINHSKKINININNSLVLDLFAGSGSFGIDCLSRGAKKVFFFENHPLTINILKKNIKSLKDIENFTIFKNNCFDFFESNQTIDLKFDLIFIDPPYKEIKINQMIDQIFEKKLLNKKGVIIIHRHKKDSVKLSEKFNVFEERIYGISKIFFGDLRID